MTCAHISCLLCPHWTILGYSGLLKIFSTSHACQFWNCAHISSSFLATPPTHTHLSSYVANSTGTHGYIAKKRDSFVVHGPQVQNRELNKTSPLCREVLRCYRASHDKSRGPHVCNLWPNILKPSMLSQGALPWWTYIPHHFPNASPVYTGPFPSPENHKLSSLLTLTLYFSNEIFYASEQWLYKNKQINK